MLGDEDVMPREPHGGLRDGALIAQEGTEALQDAEAGRHRAGGKRVTERGLNPGIHIRGCRLQQVVREGGSARLGHQDREAVEGAYGPFLYRGGRVARTQIGQIVCEYALVLRTKKGQPTELREFLECWDGRMLLHISLLFHKPRSPVEDTELSTDCLHNHHSAKLNIPTFLLVKSPISWHNIFSVL